MVLIPFADREEEEPKNLREGFDLKKRGYADAAMVLVWQIFLVGVIQNAVAGPG